MAQRISNPAIHHVDKDTAAPLSGGQLFFFEINSTTPKDTFSDDQGTIPNTNPVILDAAGVEPDIFGVGSYRVVLKNSNGVQQWERDPVNFETSGAQFEDWLSSVDYKVNDVVEGSDGVFYISIQTPNLNNDPAGGISPLFWSAFSLIGGSVNAWLSTFDYALEAIVEATDGNLYSSIQTPNVGNEPTVSPTFWIRFDILKRWNTNDTFDTGDPVTFSEAIYISKTASNQGNQPDISTSDWQVTGKVFRGALIFADNPKSQTLTGVDTVLDIFDTAEYDTDNIWAISPNPTRLTVPVGVTKVKIIANIRITSSGGSTGEIFSDLKYNAGAKLIPGTQTIIRTFDDPDGSYRFATGVFTVVAGDFFEMFGSENTDGSVTAIGSSAGFVPISSFSMEILE